MVKNIFEAARNMNLKMKNLEVVANNLANINTIGYKKQIPFSEIMDRFTLEQYKNITSFEEGALIKTGNPLDLAISGRGMFVVNTENGYMLTRNGKFTLSDDGFIVDERGNRLLGVNGPIQIKNDIKERDFQFSVTKEGEVKVNDEVINRLLIGKFDDQMYIERTNEQGFIPNGRDFIVADENEFQIHQFSLEESNVNPIMEMQHMIEINRNFETSQRMVTYYDQYLGKVNEAGKF